MTKRVALVLLLVAVPAWAGGVVNPRTIIWTAPQTNEDASALTNLVDYRIDLGPTSDGPWYEVARVAALEADPPDGRTQSLPVAWCTIGGSFWVTVAACNAAVCGARATAVEFSLGWPTVTARPAAAHRPAASYRPAP